MGDEPTLYDRIGGAEAIDRLIEDFDERVLADPELEPFFRRVPMDTLLAMQREFFAAALDGPQRDSGLSLAHAHGGRGINAGHFNRFPRHLLETLRARGIGERDAEAIIARINAYINNIAGGATVSE